MTAGYYRFPTVNKDTIVFVGRRRPVERPAWRWYCPAADLQRVRRPGPVLSPDGNWLAFVGREEGQADVYVMPVLGSPAGV